MNTPNAENEEGEDDNKAIEVNSQHSMQQSLGIPDDSGSVVHEVEAPTRNSRAQGDKAVDTTDALVPSADSVVSATAERCDHMPIEHGRSDCDDSFSAPIQEETDQARIMQRSHPEEPNPSTALPYEADTQNMQLEAASGEFSSRVAGSEEHEEHFAAHGFDLQRCEDDMEAVQQLQHGGESTTPDSQRSQRDTNQYVEGEDPRLLPYQQSSPPPAAPPPPQQQELSFDSDEGSEGSRSGPTASRIEVDYDDDDDDDEDEEDEDDEGDESSGGDTDFDYPSTAAVGGSDVELLESEDDEFDDDDFHFVPSVNPRIELMQAQRQMERVFEERFEQLSVRFPNRTRENPTTADDEPEYCCYCRLTCGPVCRVQCCKRSNRLVWLLLTMLTCVLIALCALFVETILRNQRIAANPAVVDAGTLRHPTTSPSRSFLRPTTFPTLSQPTPLHTTQSPARLPTSTSHPVITGPTSTAAQPSEQWIQLGGNVVGGVPEEVWDMFVALSPDGNVLALSVWPGVTNSSRVWVYAFVGGEWVQRGSVETGDESGVWAAGTVSLSGDGLVLAVGARGIPAEPSLVRAKAWEWNGNSWSAMGLPINWEDDDDRLYGGSVTLANNGAVLAVAADPPLSAFGNGLFRVRIYDWIGVDWVQRRLESCWSLSVALSSDGSIAACGNWNRTNGVRVVRWTGSSWIQLGATISRSHHWIRRSISLSEDGKVVAVWNADPIGCKVFEYSQVSGHWMQLGQTIEANATIGTSVALSFSGDVVVLGGLQIDNNRVGTRAFRLGPTSEEWIQVGNDILGGEQPHDFYASFVPISHNASRIAIEDSVRGVVRVFQLAQTSE